MTFLSLFTFAVAALGMTLAVYIPLVPYIIWIAVILAWVIAVVEAVIAAPLWMLSHVSGEGEGIATGAGEAGYKFVAAVFLRPTLSVISFFVASLVVMAMADIINASFMEMVKKVQSDSMTGMFTLFGFIGVYTGLCSMLINKSFGLTLTLPSSILKWFGGGVSNDDGNDSEASNTFNTVGAAVVTSSSGAAPKRMSADDKSKLTARRNGGGGEGGGKGGGGVDTDTGAGKAPTRGGGNNDGKA